MPDFRLSGDRMRSSAFPAAPEARARYRRMMILESAIGAVVNAALGAFAFWLTFRGLPSVPLWGGSGLVADTLPSTIAPVVLMTLLLTFVTRRKRAGGAFEAVAMLAAPRWTGMLPANLLARALSLAIPIGGAMTLLAYVAATGSGGTIMPWGAAFVARLACNLLVGALCSPVIVARALAEPPSPA